MSSFPLSEKQTDTGTDTGMTGMFLYIFNLLLLLGVFSFQEITDTLPQTQAWLAN